MDVALFQCIYFGRSSLLACSGISLIVFMEFMSCTRNCHQKQESETGMYFSVAIPSAFPCLSHWSILNKIGKVIW